MDLYYHLIGVHIPGGSKNVPLEKNAIFRQQIGIFTKISGFIVEEVFNNL